MHRSGAWVDFRNSLLPRTRVQASGPLGPSFGGLSWGSSGGFVLARQQHGRARGTKTRLRKRCALAPLPGQNSTSPLGEVELWFGRGAFAQC